MLDSLNRTPDSPGEIEAMGEPGYEPGDGEGGHHGSVVLPIILVYPSAEISEGDYGRSGQRMTERSRGKRWNGAKHEKKN